MPDLKAILLVGGIGSRLSSVISSKPKALAPIGERAFLELLIRQLRLQGIRNLVMCTGYLASQIETKFGDGRNWDVSIEYSEEEKPVGTAGALKLAQRYVHDIPEFIVLNGDSFLEINFHDLMSFHKSNDHAIATMAVLRMEDASRYGTVYVDATGRIKGFAEKANANAPGLVNGGVYVFSRTVWEHIPQGPASLEKDVFPRLVDQGMYAREQRGKFIDIGIPSDYIRAQESLRFS